ncbi:MAG: AMP-binding protein [Paracoccus sp. (in: a-proteobacteria)]
MEPVWQKQYNGMPAEVEYSGSIVDMFDQAVVKWGDRPAFHCLHVNLRYSEVAALSRDFAAYLQQHLGIRKGDRVAVMMPNLLTFPVVSFGIIRTGAIQVSVNPLYTPRELAHQLNDSGAETIVIFNGATPTLEAALAETNVRNIITLGLFDLCDLQGPNPPVAPGVLSGSVALPDVLLAGQKLPFDAPQISGDDLLFLQYTGGTTGLSKGAMLSHSNLVSNIAMFEWVVGKYLRSGEEVIITALPLYHIFALMVNFLCYFKHGALNVLIPNARDLPALVAEWSKFRITSLTGVNTLFIGLMNTPGFDQCDFSELRIAFAGGAPVQVAVSERWKTFTGVNICEGLGMSETSPITATNLLGRERFGTVGVPMPSTDLSIRDENGRELGIGEAGEICFRGPQVMSGYWQRENINSEVFTDDGYLLTGDIGIVDDDGYLTVVDRKKDMILVSGFNVFPNEIEAVLAEMDGLLESACVGVPDEKSGEAIRAVCVRKDPEITEEDIIAYCRQHLTAYKVPRQIIFTEALPKSTVGKILRRELREV